MRRWKFPCRRGTGVSTVRGWGGGIFMAVGLGKGVKNRVREYGLVVV